MQQKLTWLHDSEDNLHTHCQWGEYPEMWRSSESREKFYLHPINFSIHPNLYLRKNWDVIYMGCREKWMGCK